MTLVDGYAPFCKHIFIKNFTNMVPGFIKITVENEKYLKTGYITRYEKELPVLERWFDKNMLPSNFIKKAEYLDLILYSKE